MATVAVFHSALGLRPAIRGFAERLRTDGHDVVTPDLFDGAVFDDLEAGSAARDALGIPELVARAWAAVADLPSGLVYAGFSMGAMPAQLLAATRPGARGALLLEGAAPLEVLGVDAWPAGVPVQLHTCRDDSWIDHDGIAALATQVPAALWEHHEHTGGGHLVTDPDWPDHDPAVAAGIVAASRSWLSRLDHVDQPVVR